MVKTTSESCPEEDALGAYGLNLLSEPSEPHLDFVFVHGLGGGSKKTWSHSSRPGTFWPKEWLPSEPGFKHVRIHSYGYNSDWAKTQQSRLSIHDFAQALLADMYNSPHLRKNGDTPIVLVAHSMGGLVAKKAINDDFRHVSADLQLWSFFEGLPTIAGPKSYLVVEKSSAVMGLPGEHTQYLQADHRHMCKFDSPAHPNYQILQRCLLRTVEDIEKDYLLRHQSNFKSDMKMISAFLEIDGRPEADLLDVTEKQQPGSGKSIACGHVIRFLEDCNFDCSYYFLRHGNTETSTPSAFLRSLAFQMAWSNFDIRKAILAMIANNERFNTNDHNLIWNGIFVGQIFKTTFHSPQFWVIDALDECANKSLSTLLHMLSKIPRAVPLQVFLTSRPSLQVQRALSVEQSLMLELETGGENSKLDIAKFLRSRRPYGSGSDLSERIVSEILTRSNGIFLWASLVMNRLDETYAEEDMEEVLHDVPTEMNDFYSRIAKTIADSPNKELAKCILRWTVCASRSLSVDELKEAVRLDINRTLTATNDRLAHLCGDLITVDKQSNVHVIHQTVTAFLVQCDSEFKINLGAAHARLAEVCLGYLTGKDFAPPPPRGRSSRSSSTSKTHGDLALADYACANFPFHLAHCSSGIDTPLLLLETFLGSNVLTWIDHVARRGGLMTLVRAVQNMRAFLSRRAKYLPLLDKQSRLASAWVTDLAHIVAAFGSNLIDLPSSIYVMVPAISPPQSTIHQLFAKDSRRHRLLGVSNERNWDDRISCFIYESKATAVATSEQYLAVGLSKGTIMLYDGVTLQLVGNLNHGEPIRGLAFGAATGSLVAYGAKKISFWDSRRECLWTKEVKHARSPISIGFSVDEDELLVCGKDGQIHYFSAKDGSDRDELPLFHSSDSESDDDERRILPGTPPSLVRVSPVHGLAAVTYRCAPVTIWDIERRHKLGVFYRPGTEGVYQQVQVQDMVFSPVPELDLLAIAYDGVGIATCDPWTQEQHDLQGIDARIMVSSPDGRTLVAGDLSGTIHILAFETSLKVLYRISAFNAMLRSVAFSPDNLRIYEVRDNFCNVWEPPALVRRPDTFDDDSSESLSSEASTLVPEMIARPVSHDDHITCVAYPEDSKHIFCGRKNGGLSIYDAAKGTRLLDFRLYPNTSSAIKHLEWHDKKSVLIAVSTINHCIAVRVSVTPKGVCEVVLPPIFDRYIKHPVRRVLINSTGDLFHFTTLGGDEVWDSTGELVGRYDSSSTTLEEQPEHDEDKQWIQHPTNAELLLMLRRTQIHVFRWATLEPLTPSAGIPLTISGTACSADMSSPEWTSYKGSELLVRARRSSDKDSRNTCFEFLDVSSLINHSSSSSSNSITTSMSVNCLPKGLLAHVKVVIGLHKSLLYFVDVKGWVSSVTLKGLQSAAEYTRHFFIPRSWMVGENLHVLLRLMPRTNSIAMAHQDDLLIFQGFLDLEEKVAFAMEPMRGSQKL
ncbi:ba20391f-efb7-42e8-bde8-8fceab49913d [Thermothielavioides terrestris]|uniref:Ba20391f-efb7-42e8-bde8-8fceab49913d n=1 Tax=Thermothielavioides terrestris TaxID=2587410 RepID=A0A3S4CCQ6_9PEZI|nr:ba20391f-efb7-42e8-bde8-8fceab49913d [Thermothielavioides terrestris]